MQTASQPTQPTWQAAAGVGLAEMVCLFPQELALHPALVGEQESGRRLQHYQVAESVLTAAFLELADRGIAFMVQEHTSPLYRVWMHRLAATSARTRASPACSPHVLRNAGS